jgi:hypothetical protein
MYNLDPKGSVMMNGVKVPVILCHQDSYKLGLGNNHGDVYHWFKKYGKDMNDVRNDVAKILADNKKKPEAPKPTAPATDIKPDSDEVIKYVVRKTWNDSKSQIGAYIDLDNAKKARDEAGTSYEVYDFNNGELIYPIAPGSEDFKIGDTVKLTANAVWSTGQKIPLWAFTKIFYVRNIHKNGTVSISILQNGAITGIVKPEYLDLLNSNVSISVPTTSEKKTFENYLVIVTGNSVNVRSGPGTQYKINTVVKQGQVFTIIDERNGWGKLKSGAGWISLNYTKKL